MRKIIKTGIPGLDELLGGGLPQKSNTVLSGPPGVGKTIMAMQYINEGIKKNKPGLYLSIDSTVDDVIEYASNFGWDYGRHIEKGKLEIIDRTIFEQTEMEFSHDFGTLRDTMERLKPERFAVDSVTLFDFLFRDNTYKKLNMMHFIDLTKKYKCTTLMTLKQVDDFPNLHYHDWHFLSDGLIFLFWNRNRAENERCIWTAKLRERKIDSTIRTLRVTEEGVVVYTNEIPSIPFHTGV